jgi:hypothetical protein
VLVVACHAGIAPRGPLDRLVGKVNQSSGYNDSMSNDSVNHWRLLFAILWAALAFAIFVTLSQLVLDWAPVLLGIFGYNLALGASVGSLTGRTRDGALVGLALAVTMTAYMFLVVGMKVD